MGIKIKSVIKINFIRFITYHILDLAHQSYMVYFMHSTCLWVGFLKMFFLSSLDIFSVNSPPSGEPSSLPDWELFVTFHGG